jgi:hypothetical protein
MIGRLYPKLCVALACLNLWIAPAAAGSVDVAIVFAVDNSSSVDPHTADFQREGHASAIKAPEVLAAIARNEFGCIAIAYMEWSRPGSARTVLPWTMICERADAEFASLIISKAGNQGFGRSIRRSTSISYALDSGGLLLDHLPYSAGRKVIDVSTNGMNNDGLPVMQRRSSALSKGYTINAIVLPNGLDVSEEQLTTYLKQEVAGGPLSFVAVPNGVLEYAATLRRKLVQEIGSGGYYPLLLPEKSESLSVDEWAGPA